MKFIDMVFESWLMPMSQVDSSEKNKKHSIYVKTRNTLISISLVFAQLDVFLLRVHRSRNF